LKSLPEEYPFHVRVPFKMNPEQVVDLPLLEIGPLPDRGYGGNSGLFSIVASGLEDEAVVVLHREKMVNNFEVVKVVDASEVHQVV